MIVRISGLGQFELADEEAHRLAEMDGEITTAIHEGDEVRFHRLLHSTIEFVRSAGHEVSHDRVLPSQVIVPPEDVSLSEAQRFFHDDSLLHPLPA